MKIEFGIVFSFFISAYFVIEIHTRYFAPKPLVPFEKPTSKIFENCDFPKHHMEYRALRTGMISKNVCVERLDLHTSVKELCTHMRLVAHKDGHDGLVALHFGVPITVGYIRSVDLCVINPVFIKGEGRKYCVEQETVYGPLKYIYNRYGDVTITSLDEDRLEARSMRTLTGSSSCILQSLLELMGFLRIEVT